MGETTWHRSVSWWLVAGLAALVMLFGLFVLFSPVDDDDFTGETGIEWSDFGESDGEVAAYLEREARLLGAITFGFGALVTVLIIGPLRRGDIEVWRALWLFPTVLALIAVVFFAAGATSLALVYAVAAGLATTGLAMVPRRGLPGESAPSIVSSASSSD